MEVFPTKTERAHSKKRRGEKSRFIFYEMHELLAISMGGALKVLYFYLKRNRSTRILAQALSNNPKDGGTTMSHPHKA